MINCRIKIDQLLVNLLQIAFGEMKGRRFESKVVGKAVYQQFYFLNMSHLIQGVQLEGPLMLQSTSHRIVKPSFKRYLNSDTLQSFFDKKDQKKILDHICHRYSEIQQQQLEKERQLFVGQRFSLLKRKLKSNLNPSASGRSVEAYFQEQKPLNLQEIGLHPLNLKHLTENMPKTVELQKKYRAKIHIKMAAVSQAKQIQQDKERYKNLLSQQHHRTNSPNFQKMNFVFERLQKKHAYVSSKTEASSEEPLKQKFVDLLNQIASKGKSKNLLLRQSKQKQNYCKHEKKSYGSPKRRFKNLTDEFQLFNMH